MSAPDKRLQVESILASARDKFVTPDKRKLTKDEFLKAFDRL